MTIHFEYNRKQVIQALRYHFLTRPEIRILLILINVFAISSAVLFAMKKIQPLAFLIFSFLWFMLMLMIWRVLPHSIYRKAHTFKDDFSMSFQDEQVVLENQRGSKAWAWKSFSTYLESPYFFHLYFDSRSFFLVPKDAFKDISDLQQTRKLLKEKIKKG
ncbi:MAG: YcxB family protein [Williamsia sp.]|nr:YcxB family protein [Williamsia sp.]